MDVAMKKRKLLASVATPRFLCHASEVLEERDYSVLDCIAPLEGQVELDWTSSWGMLAEAADEKVL